MVRQIQRILRRFFQQLYSNLSWSYDIVAWVSSMGQWRAWQDAAVLALNPGSVLELGFGTGHLLCAMVQRGHKVTGLDPSPQMLAIARRRTAELRPEPILMRASAENIPIRREAFDQVIATFPSDYILHDQTLREVFRVLKTSGQLVIIPGVYDITGPMDQSKRLLKFFDRIASWLYSLTGEKTDGSSRWKEELVDTFSKIGFTPEISYVQQTRATVLRITAIKR